MKKTIIASLAVLASAAVLTAFALGGAGKFGNVLVNAEPKEYSVTFDDDTPYQVVGGNYVFYAETESGNKVGLVATKYVDNVITFHGMDFESLYFFDKDGSLTKAGVYGFSSITYFDFDYSGGHLWFFNNDYDVQDIDGGKQKTAQNPPTNPYVEPEDFEGPKATISSITIWYSC